jgi:pentatricopeptide repeat protein
MQQAVPSMRCVVLQHCAGEQQRKQQQLQHHAVHSQCFANTSLSVQVPRYCGHASLALQQLFALAPGFDVLTTQPPTCHAVPLLHLLSLQLYTAAINACMANDGTNFDAAFDIYATMQRNGVEPDDLLYGHLIALAGRCRKLEVRCACCCGLLVAELLIG